MLQIKYIVDHSDTSLDKHALRGQSSKFTPAPRLWAEPSGRQLEESFLYSARLPQALFPAEEQWAHVLCRGWFISLRRVSRD